MKKIVVLLSVIIIAFSSNAQTKNTKFYYYPSSNVYYNTASGKYIYNNSGTWTTVKTLPSNFAIARTPRVIVYNANARVWENNSDHRAKYKAAKFKPIPPGQLKKRAIKRGH
jgi:hypothetical protein